MKFRWSEWLTAVALVLAFSAFAGAEASDAPATPTVQVQNLSTGTSDGR